MAQIFQNVRAILPDGVRDVSVRIEAGVITALDGPTDGAEVIEGQGRILAPAMVDIHGDAFERQVMPRPNVFFPLDGAVLDTDRQLATNGITTAYHAVTLSWETGLRSVDQGTAFAAALERLAPRLTVDNRMQLRWETFCFEALPLIDSRLSKGDALAFNDHTSMIMIVPNTPLQTRPFELDDSFPICTPDDPRFIAKMRKRSERVGMSAEALRDRILDIYARRPDVPAMIARIAEMGRAVGAPMLSHDDSQIVARDYFRDLGARISEFPMNDVVAQSARDNSDWIVFGAPNAARGGSHLGSPSAIDMFDRGLCDILASDYFYPAMLAAVARMVAGGRDLAQVWKLVSTNPARASHLSDRGEIAVGQRADLVLIDWPDGQTPAPVMTVCGGRTVYQAG